MSITSDEEVDIRENNCEIETSLVIQLLLLALVLKELIADVVWLAWTKMRAKVSWKLPRRWLSSI
jgi:hypothetical protein